MPSLFPAKPASDEVTVKIGGKAFRFWDGIEIHLSLDSQPTVSFNVPFEPERSEFRKTFRPMSFADLTVSVGSDLLFTGTLIDVVPNVQAESRTASISAYAKPGALADSYPPASLLPAEMRGLNLRQIAEKLCAPLGIEVEARAPSGAVFKKTKPPRESRVLDYLSELARQRGQIISSTADGKLLLWRSESSRPVVALKEGASPLHRVSAAFSPQSYYSEITGYVQTKRGRTGAVYTEQNPFLSGGPVRAASFQLSDTEAGDAPAAVSAKLGRMFANAASYVADVPTWRDPAGNLWAPNTTVTLDAPSAMVYSKTNLLVRDVFLRQTASELSASLGLVLPGAFSGEVPDSLPWEG